MKYIDKKHILRNLDHGTQLELELGCGNRKRNRNAIGIDILDYPDVDIVGDVYHILSLFPSNSVNAIYGYHFIEHIPDVPKLIYELARILKSNGHVEFVAPHFSNPYFYSDPTHRSFFGLYTFCYFAEKSPFARQVPIYESKIYFQMKSVDLIFKSSQSFIMRYGLKRIIGGIFNSCTYMKELFEENFCYLFPCYEIRYILQKNELLIPE